MELEAAVTKRTADAMEGAVAAARQEGIETGRQQAALEAAALTDMKHGSMQDAAVQANATPQCTERYVAPADLLATPLNAHILALHTSQRNPIL